MFSTLYETLFGIYYEKYQLIFSTLNENGSYLKLGLLFIIIPLVLWCIFYFVWRYPYGRKWHWGLWLVITGIIVLICTWQMSKSEIFVTSNQQLYDALNDPQSGYNQYAQRVINKYSAVNFLLSLVLGFVYSLFLKQYSKIQMHLPF